MKIYRTSAAKDKIVQYKINDPFLKFLIFQNENIIPWNQIPTAKQFKQQNQEPQSENLINQYVKNTLIPQMHKKIDPENKKGNYYLKDIDLEKEFRNNSNDPQVQQAYAIYQNDPEAAKQQILEEINNDKEEAFNNWWDYLNEQYGNYPSFIYLMLKSSIESSPPNKHTPPPPLDANAVAAVFESLKNDTGKGNLNLMQEFLNEVSKSANVIQGDFENGWIFIPAQYKSQEDEKQYDTFENNIKKLKTYGQAGGWCVGQDTWANKYLSRGNFYIYVTNNKPVIAIRTEGDTVVAEIRGKSNDEKNMYPYWQEVNDFLKNSKLNYKNNFQYQTIEEIAQFNNQIIKDPDTAIPNVINQINTDPSVYDKLSKENAAIPQIKEAALNKWKQMVLEDTEIYKSVPKSIVEEIKPEVFAQVLNYYSEGLKTFKASAKEKGAFDNLFKYFYSELPEDVKQILLPELIPFAKEFWKDRIKNNLKQTESCPPEILNDPEVKQEATKIWMEAISHRPWIISDCPKTIIDNFPKDFAAQTSNHLVTQLIHHLQTSSDENPENIIEEYNEGFEKLQEDEKTQIANVDNLREIDEVYDNLLMAWEEYIRGDLVDRYQEFVWNDYEYYKSNDINPVYDDHMNEVIRELWDSHVWENPANLYDLPEDRLYDWEPAYTDEPYLAQVWDSYLPNHPDQLDDIQPDAIVDVNPQILANTLKAYIEQYNNIPRNIFHYFENNELPQDIFIVFNALPPEGKNEVVDKTPEIISKLEYGQKRHKDQLLLEQGQQEFDFQENAEEDKNNLEEVATTTYWYKKAKLLENYLK